MQAGDDLEELLEYGADLEETIEDLKRSIETAKKLSDEPKKNKVRYIEDRLKRAYELLESYTAELRSRKGVSEQYKRKREEYQNDLNKLIPDINNLNAQTGFVANKYDLILSNAEQYKTEQLVQQGIEVQDQIVASLDRQLKDIEASKQIAVDTIAELGRQEEVLKKIGEDVQDIRENLKHAVKQLRVIARNMAKDWIIRIFCCLVLMALIAAIIVLAVLPNNSNPLKGFPVTIPPLPSSSFSLHSLDNLFFAFIFTVFFSLFAGVMQI